MSLPDSTFFQIERHGAVVELAMNRPDKANGMTPDFWADLPVIIGALDAESTVRAIVLTGRGRNFTGGMDISNFQNLASMMQAEPGRAAYAFRKEILRLQASISALEQTDKPVIAAIQGACIGGGIDLITACDIRLAAADAYFSVEEIHLAIAADVGTLQRLPRLIAPGIVSELTLTGRRFSPEEAASWGLINAIHPDAASVRQAALDMAADIAAKSPLAVAGAKRALTYSRDHPVADGLDQIATWNAGMLRPEDMMGAIQARMARKEAVFEDLLAQTA